MRDRLAKRDRSAMIDRLAKRDRSATIDRLTKRQLSHDRQISEETDQPL